VVLDDSRELLPVPYVIYERVLGRTLARLELDPPQAAPIWQELGRDLARVHGTNAVELPEQETLPDPRDLLEPRVAQGWFTVEEARWLRSWLDRLAVLTQAPTAACVLHGDSQATNVLVQATPLQYRAVIDWGGAAWGDVANDFAGVPLRAVPFMLEGHREVLPLDEGIEARIVWRHLQLVLLMLPRGAVRGRSWAERPLAIFVDVLRFFLSQPGGAWRNLAPL
jgi:Ser/Thr protein kinase RdoA (MazF antagonist)